MTVLATVAPPRPASARPAPELTPEQRAIVEAPDGPVVVIAGAGTGKTRVIVERVRWLLETKGDVRALTRMLLLQPRPSCAAGGAEPSGEMHPADRVESSRRPYRRAARLSR